MTRVSRPALSMTLLFAALCLSVLLCPKPALAGQFDLQALMTEASKVVPEGFELVSKESDDLGAFASWQKGDHAFQFTLSEDMDPQVPDAEKIEYKGMPAWFFTPGLDSSGGLMIILQEDVASLTIIYSEGYSSTRDITREEMTALADKMDLNKLK